MRAARLVARRAWGPWRSFGVALGLALCACPGVPWGAAWGAVPARAFPDAELPEAFRIVDGALMTPAGFSAVDFDLLLNYRAAIPPTLPAVETLLRRPAAIDSMLPALRGSLRGATRHGFLNPDPFWSWIGASAPARSSGFARFLRRVGLRSGPRSSPRSAQEAAADLVKPYTPGELAFLAREAPGLFRAAAEDTSRDAWELELERQRGEKVVDSVMALAARLPWASLARAARAVEERSRRIAAALRDERPERLARELRALRAEGDKFGYPVMIGTSGNDVHRVSHGVVFDPGGDDRYVFPDTARPGTWLLVIDAAGNDVYEARDTVGAAAGFLSAQAILDLAGDDRYLGVDLAFGAAVMGYSSLNDLAGNDVYEARAASLGFAFHGIGILRDAAGDDLYSTAYLSQGAATTRGLGLLLDDAGEDRYVSRPVYPDDLRYRDKFLSLSQGFSTGFAPRYAGGIAVLWDKDGNDAYASDIFGQGTGYWFGWGLLLDERGNDAYKAYQYAQGAGVHFAVGTLIDLAGEDARVSKGVSQGCGHDGGFGLLADHAGNDSTVAVDMSAGAGSANGLGVYVDFAGRDVYDMAQPRRTLGHADMRRDRGSMGFFLDLGGELEGAVGTDAGPDALPAEGGFTPDSTRVLYEGKHQGHGFGLDAR